jgi:hypothetical protein
VSQSHEEAYQVTHEDLVAKVMEACADKGTEIRFGTAKHVIRIVAKACAEEVEAERTRWDGTSNKRVFVEDLLGGLSRNIRKLSQP